jgi:hypothetical protein
VVSAVYVPPPNLAGLLAVMHTQAVTDEELDLLAAADHAHHVHQAGNPEAVIHPDADWGPCTECGDPWPCLSWSEVHVLAVEWLSRRAGQAVASARQTLDSLPGPLAEERRAA